MPATSPLFCKHPAYLAKRTLLITEGPNLGLLY